MERASKPYRRRRCSLGAQACHPPFPPRDGSECRAIGSEVQLQARQPRQPGSDLSNPPAWHRGPFQSEGWEAVRRHVLSALDAWQPGLLRTAVGILVVARRAVARSTPSPRPLHARRISKRETDLALVGKGAYWLLFTIPSPTPGPRTLARRDGSCLHWRTRETHDKCIPSACQLGRAVMRSSKRRASLASSYSASHCSVAGFQGSTSDEASLEARHDGSRLPGSWEGG